MVKSFKKLLEHESKLPKCPRCNSNGAVVERAPNVFNCKSCNVKF